MRTSLGRFISALAALLLLSGTLVESYFQSFGFYQEHYLWPKEKYGVVIPLRWQDILFLVVFWPVAIALFYLSYRLLKYAFTMNRPKALKPLLAGDNPCSRHLFAEITHPEVW